jgi:hypothetical protein
MSRVDVRTRLSGLRGDLYRFETPTAADSRQMQMQTRAIAALAVAMHHMRETMF